MATRSILVGALSLGVAACSVVLGFEDLPVPVARDAATPSESAQVTSDALAAPRDAEVDVEVDRDAGSDAGRDAGNDAEADEMVAVLGGSYAIDATEVTKRAYERFLSAIATGAVDAGGVTHPACGWKTSNLPGPSCAVPVDGDGPMTCIDWCDAWAYCAWRGARLCGAIGGGAVAPADRANTSKSQWRQACGGFGQKYPYGAEVNESACATRDVLDGGGPQRVGASPSCEGAPRGLFDMVGNLSEWDDSCAGGTDADAGPAEDQCAAWGGSFLESSTTASCEFVTTHPRSRRLPSLGFRCCRD